MIEAVECELHHFLCSFLDQVGNEESPCVSPPPAAEENSCSDTDALAVRHANITDLISEALGVSAERILYKSIVLLKGFIRADGGLSPIFKKPDA